MAVAVGIDLGTTNTVVAAVREGVATTIAAPGGRRLIPSVVSFHPSGNVLVGDAALDRRLIDPEATVFSVKRLIGRTWNSPEVQEAAGRFSFGLREGPKGGTVVVARGETYSLPEISAFVLRQARAVAEAALGEPVDRAVITVPANFNDLQRAATKMAGRLAGIEVLRILNEPTAAALAYGTSGKENERIAIYDLGGGTFDVTILDLAGNVFEVLATAGDTALGGDDIDLVVAQRMADDVLKKHRFDARAQPAVFTRLRMLAEHVKQELTTQEEFTLAVDDLVPGDRGSTVTWQYRMTRPELEWASLALVERTFKVCQQALESAGCGVADLDRIILVGGSTRMPMVARKVEQFFGRPPVVRINPDEVVALGAAIQAALLDRNRRASVSASPPRIDEASVVAPIPEAPSAFELGVPLPVVDSKGAIPVAKPAPSPPRAPPPPPRAPAPPPPAPAAPAGAGTFLPGSAGKPLVFDVPEKAVSPFEIELAPAPPPRAPMRTIVGVAAPAAPPEPAVLDMPPPMRPPRTTLRMGRELTPEPLPPPPPDPPSHPAAIARPAPAPAPAAPRPPRAAPLLIDVTPLALGVETVGGFCDILIDANTPVPCDRTRTFATATDNQTTVQLRVSQGSSRKFAENTCLGELELSGIQAAMRGEQKIAVTFEIDADGILNVRAKDVASGRETLARMQLVGAQGEPADLDAMRARQAAHPLAPLA
jgi:molecular chaperone DnaK